VPALQLFLSRYHLFQWRRDMRRGLVIAIGRDQMAQPMGGGFTDNGSSIRADVEKGVALGRYGEAIERCAAL
jgi:hypothetical protein